MARNIRAYLEITYESHELEHWAEKDELSICIFEAQC